MIGLRRYLVFFFIIFCFQNFSSKAHAAEDIVLRLQASPETPWVGQKVTVHLDVLARDGWVQIKAFRETNIKGGFLHRYENQGTRLNENIDGGNYTGQRYELFFFGFRAGEIRIPSVQLDVEIKRWGQKDGDEVRRLQTPPLSLQMQMPKEIPTVTGLISSQSFTANQHWEPAAEKLKVGDAVTRTIKREAVDVSAMLFSPIEYPEQAGIGTYPAEPEVQDSFNRGELTGKRVEKITYILEQGGTYTMPDLEFYWWDIKNEKLEKTTLAGLQVEVVGAAISSKQKSAAPKKNDFMLYAAAIGMAAAFFVISWRRKSIYFYICNYREKRNQSEKAYFARIGKAARTKDAKGVLNNTMKWLDVLPGIEKPARFDLFLLKYQSQDVSHNLVLPLDSESGTLLSFYHELESARKRYMLVRKGKLKAEKILPSIGLKETR